MCVYWCVDEQKQSFAEADETIRSICRSQSAFLGFRSLFLLSLNNQRYERYDCFHADTMVKAKHSPSSSTATAPPAERLLDYGTTGSFCLLQQQVSLTVATKC